MEKLDVRSLKRELVEAGVFENREAESWLKFAGLFVVLGGLLFVHTVIPWWGTVLLMPVTGLIATTIAMMGHEGSHRALSKSNARNDLMMYVAFPLFSGLGAMYWSWKHNVQHHNHTNITHQDPDIEVWPMAASAECYHKAGPFQRWFQRNLQGFAYWPLTGMLAWAMRASSFKYAIRTMRARGLHRRLALDIICQVSHYILWLGGSYLLAGVWGIVFYLVLWAIVGVYLAAVFSPAHMTMPVLLSHSDRWRLQFETTQNLTMPAWLSWFFIGLDYQVEHHLFPSISHMNMRKASTIVKRWAAQHDVPYFEVNFFSGLADVTRYMHHAWKYEPTAQNQIDTWPAERSGHNAVVAA